MAKARFQAVVALGVLLAVPAAARADGDTVQTIRDDVRLGPPESPSPPASQAPESPTPNRSGKSDSGWNFDIDDAPLWIYGLIAVGAGVTSPIWGPHYLLDDDFSNAGYFRPFPYDAGLDYIEKAWSPGIARPLAVRLDAEYATSFDRLDNLAGHLLVETAPRFGLAASWTYLDGRLADGGHDTLSLGDCDLVYRFAQAPWAEFRSGCGLNWMADSGRADLGFNFMYAADFYPCKPWVISSELDGGTLGRAGLFRFRTTAGVVLHGVETYIGYEYTDISQAHWNGLIGGLRLWF